jgi:hypothetical protein
MRRSPATSVIMVVIAMAEAGVAVTAAMEAGDHKVILKMKALGVPSRAISIGHVASPDIRLRTVDPWPRRWVRPILLKKRRAAY